MHALACLAQIAEAGPTPDFDAKPLDGNLFEWHFTIRGPPGTAFEGGRYHGRITLPPESPFKPPSIALLNASGRFSVGKKICLSVSAHHPEHWQPAWGIRTIITALIAFFPSKADGALAGFNRAACHSAAWARTLSSDHCTAHGSAGLRRASAMLHVSTEAGGEHQLHSTRVIVPCTSTLHPRWREP